MTEHIKRKKSLVYSIIDGSFYSVMVGFGELFFPAFAVYLRASTLQIGILGSLPMTLGYISQLFAQRLVNWFGSRKRFVNITVLLQALQFLFLASLVLVKQYVLALLLLFVTLYWITGMVNVPAWNSWMGDLVYEHKRGSYFGLRNVITGMANIISFSLAGFLLQNSPAERGFVILFVVAFVARMLCYVFLELKYEPLMPIVKDTKLEIWKFLKKLNNPIYSNLVSFQFFMNFAMYCSVPYFAPYMLKELNYSYALFTLVTGAAIIAKYLAMPILGRFCDKQKAKRVLIISSFLMPLSPLFWMLSRDLHVLIPVQIIAGIAWAGYELASFVYMYDITTVEQRTSCVAFANALTGLAFLAGSLLGWIFFKHPLLSSGYLTVFGLSALLRLVSASYFAVFR